MTAALSAYPPAVWALLLGTSVLIGLLAGFLGVGGGVNFLEVADDLADGALAVAAFDDFETGAHEA